MSEQDAFERVLASLYGAMLDDTHWPATSALIDEACGTTANAVMVGGGPADDIRVGFVGLYQRGRRRTDLEREYLEIYHPSDERVPRVRQLPDGKLVHVTDTFSAEELKTSATYNEILMRNRGQNGLTVRMDGLEGSHMTWGLADPVARQDWGSSQLAMVERLIPHVRQFVRVRQALVQARAYRTSLTALLENRRIGVVHLDRQGRIRAANDRARHILGNGDGVFDRDGVLCTGAPGGQSRLDRLLAGALPAGGGVAVSGSMALRRANGLPPLVVHVRPVAVPQPDYGARHTAALVLLVEPGPPHRVDPRLVAETLGLTAGESQVAAWLAEGRRVEDMARETGRTKDAIYWHLKQIYQKHNISRQADLIRLVQSAAGLD